MACPRSCRSACPASSDNFRCGAGRPPLQPGRAAAESRLSRLLPFLQRLRLLLVHRARHEVQAHVISQPLFVPSNPLRRCASAPGPAQLPTVHTYIPVAVYPAAIGGTAPYVGIVRPACAHTQPPPPVPAAAAPTRGLFPDSIYSARPALAPRSTHHPTDDS